ncbi:PREDICTED: uncharacterized protein LOC104600125 [Nelumbo nucifera]|uniref:Uncharacterized protein LOC104600125 n=1 Tax=Nelumbo nucifera TaxID=4432 RepID=A0A1U8A853_NELNU|nr:PREDICTED: uncharacterized protein LOC104600125 [Nelumbo nucifera]
MKEKLKALLVDRITKEIRANTVQRPSSSKKNFNLHCDKTRDSGQKNPVTSPPDPSPSAIQQGTRIDVNSAIALSKRKPKNQGINSTKLGKCSPLPSSSVSIIRVAETLPITNSPSDLSTPSSTAENMEIDANQFHIQTEPATSCFTPSCKHIPQTDAADTTTSALHLVEKVIPL